MDLERYSRQILYPGIGQEGQKKLSNSQAVIIGCGALGSMHAEMMARAGVGSLRIVDRDFIEPSNLQRQIMFDESDVVNRLPKAIAAERHIGRINSEVRVEAIVRDVNYSNIEDLIRDADVVLDGTDNFEVRYLINDAAVKLNKVWVYGAAVGAYGAQMTIQPHHTPCLRCVFPDMPPPGTSPTCDTAGVILPIIAAISSFQVTEALKILTGRPDLLHGQLLQIDLWEAKLTGLNVAGLRMNSDCRTCGQGIFDYLNAQSGQMLTTLCGRNAIQITPAREIRLDLPDLAAQLQGIGEVSYNRYLLRFRIGAQEMTVFPDARSIIKGTDDPNLARSLYARYIGL